jgi:GDP-L-fucose synthase
MNKKQKLLLIGSSGFLGKNIKKIFHNEGYNEFYEIFEIDGKSTLDITIEKDLDTYIKENQITHIINSAAYVGGIAFGYSNPADLLSKNLNMAHVLYKVAHENNIDILINPISNCAYPASRNQYKESIFWDGPPHESVFNYGFSKRAFVALGNAYFSQYQVNSANVVLSNMYGPNDHFEEKRSHALGALISKIYNAKQNKNEEVTIWGDGTPIREWLFIEDGARALLQSLKLKGDSHFFNVGVNKGISINDLAKIIAKCFDWNGSFVYDVTKPNGVLEKTVVDLMSKKLINWEPRMDLDTGIKQTVNWYIKSQNE